MDYVLISKKKSYTLIVIGLLLTVTTGASVDEKDASKPSEAEPAPGSLENLRTPRSAQDEELKTKLLELDDSEDYEDFPPEDPNAPRKLTRFTTPVRAGERFDPTLFESGSMEEFPAPPDNSRKNVDKSKSQGVNRQNMASTVRPKRMPSPSIPNDESTSPLVNSLEMDSSVTPCNYPGCLGQQMIPQPQFINADYEFVSMPWFNPQKILAKRESAGDKTKTPSEVKSSQVFLRPSKPQQIAPMSTGSHNAEESSPANHNENHFMHNSNPGMTHASDQVYRSDKTSQTTMHNFESGESDNSDINRNPHIQFIPLTIHKIRLSPVHTEVEEIPFEFVRQQTAERSPSPEEILERVHQRLHQYQYQRLMQQEQEQIAQRTSHDFMERSSSPPQETFYPRRVPEDEPEYDASIRQPPRLILEGEFNKDSEEFDQPRFIPAKAPFALINLVDRHPVAVDMNDDAPTQYLNPSYHGDMPIPNRAQPVQWEQEYEQGYNPMSNQQAGYESQRMILYSPNNDGVRTLNHGESGLHKREMSNDYMGYMSE